MLQRNFGFHRAKSFAECRSKRPSLHLASMADAAYSEAKCEAKVLAAGDHRFLSSELAAAAPVAGVVDDSPQVVQVEEVSIAHLRERPNCCNLS